MLRMPDGWHTVSLGVPPTSLWAWVPLATRVRAPYSVSRARGKNTKSGSEMTTKSKESRIKLDFCQYVSIFWLTWVGNTRLWKNVKWVTHLTVRARKNTLRKISWPGAWHMTPCRCAGVLCHISIPDPMRLMLTTPALSNCAGGSNFGWIRVKIEHLSAFYQTWKIGPYDGRRARNNAGC